MRAYIEVYSGGKARIKVYSVYGFLEHDIPVDGIRVEVNRDEVRGVDEGKKTPLIVINGARN